MEASNITKDKKFMKTLLKGSRFVSREDIIQNTTVQLHTIPK
jgi:hypothetical protein